MFRIMAYTIRNGVTSYLPTIFNSEASAYEMSDWLNDRERFAGVAFAPVRVK